MVANNITVEVAYATPSKQHLISVDAVVGMAIMEVINLSGILSVFPEIDLAQQWVGIFSEKKCLMDKVQAGDRIEIYRPLIVDPKEARRGRANARRVSPKAE